MPIDPRSRGEMQTIRLPLPQILAVRNASSDKDGLLKNCYKEETPLGPMIVKRPGYTLNQALGAGTAQGAITFNDNGLFIVGDTIASGLDFVNGAVWQSASSSPTGQVRAGAAICDMDGVMYLSGGSSSGATQIFSDVWKSVDHGHNWTQVNAGASFGNRAFHGMVAINGVLYVFGGYTVKSAGTLSTPTATMWKSVDGGVTWTAATSMGTARTKFGYTVLGSSIVVTGGVSSSGTQLNSVEKMTSGAWSTLTGAASWSARSGMGLTALDGNLYLTAGTTTGLRGNGTNDVWRSSDSGATWTQLTASAAFSTRNFPALLSTDGKLFLMGGYDPAFGLRNDVWYSVDGGTWTSASSSVGWAARSGMGACINDGTLFVYGGGTQSATVLGDFTVSLADMWNASRTTGTALVPTPPIPNQPFQMAIIPQSGTTPEKVFIKNNNIAYVWDGVTLTQVTDSDYPPTTVWGVVYLDGTIYVMNEAGQINGSDLNAPTSWNALNFITANSTPDRAIALVKQLNYIVAFKEFSTEFFYDAGNTTGSPLAKVQNALLQIGLATPGSISFADNSVYFMANSKQKGRSIMKLDGYTPKVLSNQYIDRILNGDGLSEVYSFIIKSNGHFFYVLTLVNSNKTLVFDEVTGEWHEWAGATAGSAINATSIVGQPGGMALVTLASPHGQEDGAIVTIAGTEITDFNSAFVISYNSSTMTTSQFGVFPLTPLDPDADPITGTFPTTFYTDGYFPIAYYAYGDDKDLMLGRTNGNVYSFLPSAYQDDGVVIDVFARTALVDMGVMAVKRFNRLELVGDRVDTVIYTRYTDDDYQTFSYYRAIKMAKSRAKVSNLGSARRRAFDFKHVDNTELRLIAAEIDFNLGSF